MAEPRCPDATDVGSADGTRIVVHDLGGDGPPVLLSHATGFHAHCLAPLASALPGRRSYALDHRGHGDAGAVDPSRLSWTAYGDDALAAARHVSEKVGGPVTGVGHSMGGASLIMAAVRRPELFAALYLYEPIVFPPPDPDAIPRAQSPLPAGARRRRAVFPDEQAALENFSAKPPMSTFDPAVREAYVGHGFTPCDGGITLKCAPEHEARTYETGATSGAWGTLPSLAVPTWIMSGAVAPHQPSSFAHLVAENIPGAVFVRWDEMGHFGPLEHPVRIGSWIHAAEISRMQT
jgi:pimeloyl-ACP methyl ester carboxylesterase